MTTILKVAVSEQEIDDVLCLRHQVYVIEDGKFGGKPLPGQRIVDKYDAMPSVANIIAYDGCEPIGTIRVVKQSKAGLPSEGYVDFTEYKNEILNKFREEPLIASAGMLAITSKGRNRRDVIMALFKMATGVCKEWGVTHVIASANHETVSVYEHLGFHGIGEKVWVEEIHNHIVPMVAPFDKPFKWAFKDLFEGHQLDRFWLDYFSGRFERVLLNAGEVLFEQGDTADCVYIVDEGWVSIVKSSEDMKELNLAKLSKGALLGELALIDDNPRSASAIASTRSEVIRLEKSTFKNVLKKDGEGVERLLGLIASRIRATHELAMVMAYAPQTGRVKFALDELKKTAQPHRKNDAILVAKSGPEEIARIAGVREFEVRRILEMERVQGALDYSDRWVHFVLN